jgi:pimeloyl-ACP methyl ester carboxylesterase
LPRETLDTHIDEVIALIDRERLTNVVLVGHSYAGFVVTGVCDPRPEMSNEQPLILTPCCPAFLDTR